MNNVLMLKTSPKKNENNGKMVENEQEKKERKNKPESEE